MKFYIKENFITEKNIKNAGSKARMDMEFLLEKNGFQPLILNFEHKSNGNNLILSFYEHFIKYFYLKKALLGLKKGDELIIQFPMIIHTLLFIFIIKDLISRGVKVILLVHDIEMLRTNGRKSLSLKSRIRIFIEESSILKNVTKIIVHNFRMKEYLLNNDLLDDKLISLDIFDYLIPNDYKFNNDYDKSKPIIIAGNLSLEKAGYLDKLPTNLSYNLYGVGYKGNNESYINYKGAFIPDELLRNLNGSFGLIWDGDTIETCSGSYGNYLRYNNSHKASLYLVAGYPIIVWSQSALASFVNDFQCGIIIESLSDIAEIVNNLTDSDYRLYRKNAEIISYKIRSGFFLENALNKIKENL